MTLKMIDVEDSADPSAFGYTNQVGAVVVVNFVSKELCAICVPDHDWLPIYISNIPKLIKALDAMYKEYGDNK